jgi:hypothetical protein
MALVFLIRVYFRFASINLNKIIEKKIGKKVAESNIHFFFIFETDSSKSDLF